MSSNNRLEKTLIGYWQVSEKPTIEELSEYYSTKYYQESRGSYEYQYSSDELAYFKSKIEQRSFIIDKYLTKDHCSLLDVGCGEGFTLSYFLKKDWEVKGIDFSSSGVESQNPNCLEYLEIGDVNELLQVEIDSGKKYDVIWLQNVLEHVLDPEELLRSLIQIVRPGGLSIVTVPNDFSITQLDLLQKGYIDREFWIALPDHISYFDRESLTSIANHTGWKCLEMQGDFPVDWYLFNQSSNYIQNRSIGKLAHNARIDIENLMHESPLELSTNFFKALADIGFGRNLTAFLQPL